MSALPLPNAPPQGTFFATTGADVLVWERCRRARNLEERGDYETACAELGHYWPSIGDRPRLEGLSPRVAAELLLCIGTLSGSIGNSQQIAGANQIAQKHLSGSIALFECADESEKAIEAEIELAWCYWRDGRFDLARNGLREAIGRLNGSNNDLRLRALCRLAAVECDARRLRDGLAVADEAAELLICNRDHLLEGKFHNTRATILKNLGDAEQNEAYTRRAVEEYYAAAHYFELAAHKPFLASVENNLGNLYRATGDTVQAAAHLKRARELFVELDDTVRAAWADETLARLLIAEERYAEADILMESAVKTLEASGRLALLAETLITHGVALARLDRKQQARFALERARQAAERCGDSEGAGRATITILEELFDTLSDDDRSEIYTRADQLLSVSQHEGSLQRLRACEERVAEAHAAYEKRRAEEAQSEKLTALGRLAFGVAHDFNNLLTGILGSVQVLQRRADLSQEVRRRLDVITTAAYDGAQMIREIQDYARQRRDQNLERVDVAELLENAREITRPRIEADPPSRRVHVEIDCSGTPDIMGDAAELRRVLVNMIYNAIDVMPEGGLIRLGAACRDNRVVISVSDDGPGMTEEVRARIFDPFFTTKGSRGTGMGMAVSYGIVCRHQGTLEVESAIGRGATFRISLPAAPPRADETAGQVAGKHATARHVTPTELPVILVVEDEQCIRDLLRETLEFEGCEVVTARDGEEALELFGTREFDCLFTDVNMPGMNGWDLTRAVRERRPSIPVAVITGLGAGISLAEKVESQANWIVTKPFDLSRIAEVAGEVARLHAIP